MTRQDTIDALRRFHGDLVEYRKIVDRILSRGRDMFGNVPMSQATPDERARISELRSSLAVQYGRVRQAIIEATGGRRDLHTFGENRGDVFDVALADPAGHPLLLRALDATTQLSGTALGHFEQLRGEDPITTTSIVYWWRRSRGRVEQVYREVKDWLQIHKVAPVLKLCSRWNDGLGVKPKIVQTILRPSRLATTMDLYVHAYDDDVRDAIGTLDRALGS